MSGDNTNSGSSVNAGNGIHHGDSGKTANGGSVSLLSQGERDALPGLLFPHITKQPADYEGLYPPRDLPPDAVVTRIAPSPTGFIHLGNLYSALTGERLAHQSGGRFFLRIEDTDSVRKIPGAVEMILSSLAFFGVEFDEGATEGEDRGAYGPYRQSLRAELYQTMVCQLLRMGRAYPCFCSEEELAAIRAQQTAEKQNPGYYGPWARHRDLTLDEIKKHLEEAVPFVIRFRSMGDVAKTLTLTDGIRGKMTMPENDQDFVLLKTDGIPTYHFAHVVDDHFMRTTHVVRGEEWLSTWPYHWELFQAFGYTPPIYNHTTVLMKMEGASKRKLSKRKDPELGLDYYRQLGYLPQAVRTYLMTVLNSNYEEWQRDNPSLALEAFPFTTEKMGSSGALFDLDKLNNVSKDAFAAMSAEEICGFLCDWAETAAPVFYALMTADLAYVESILRIGRGGNNPRKDLVYGQQIMDFIGFFFDALFAMEDPFPERIGTADALALLEGYMAGYQHGDDNGAWFAKVRTLGEQHGFAARPKDFQNNPETYKGHVGDVSELLRVALTGRRNAPDLWEVQQILGEARSKQRIADAMVLLGVLASADAPS